MSETSETKNKYESHPIFIPDIVHGLIELGPHSAAIISTEGFQRLKNIKQLGACGLVFPLATHCRFEHCVGTAYLGRRAAATLVKKNYITLRQSMWVEVSALLHDIGHGPFSHTFDNELEQIQDVDYTTILKHHEDRSLRIIDYVCRQFPELFKEDDISAICHLVDPTHSVRPSHVPTFLSEIVNNPVHHVDVDKMDYLLRDSKYLQLQFTKYVDVVGLLERCEIVKSHWMFDVGDQHIIYDLICLRLLLHSQYYQNPRVTEMDLMLRDVINIYLRKNPEIIRSTQLSDPDHFPIFFKFTDNFLLDVMNNPSQHDETLVQKVKDLFTPVCKYTFVGDYYRQRDIPYYRGEHDNDEENQDIKMPYTVYVDKSTPLNVLPKVFYHCDGDVLSTISEDRMLVRVLRRNPSPKK